MITDTQLTIANIIANASMTLEEIVKKEIDDWLTSERRDLMLTGEAYYRNKTDIELKRVALKNRSNIRRAHGFAKELVDQKTNYLISKPPTIKSENDDYNVLLGDVFNANFLRILKNIGKDAINDGIAWTQVYIKDGKIAFKRIKPYEVIPFWLDSDHTELDALIRVYDQEVYVSKLKKTIQKVEFWDKDTVKFYTYESGVLRQDDVPEANHFTLIGSDGKPQPYKWTKVPFVAWKYNAEEQPFIDTVKSLIDDYNYQASRNSDLLADISLLVYVLKGYGGTDLDEFIKFLEQYRAICVEATEGAGVDTIQVNPDTQAVENTLTRTRQEIHEFGRAVDTQSETVGNAASGEAQKIRFTGLDMDCNELETEFQSSFEQILWFVTTYTALTGGDDFEDIPVDIIFNRDIIIFESMVIDMCAKSKGIVSDQTIRENHPWSADDEEKRIESEKQAAMNEYAQQVKISSGGGDGDEE